MVDAPNAVAAVVALLSMSMVSVAHAGRNVWTPLGPTGGSVYELVVDPTSANTAYARTDRGGIFKTVDAGTTWRPLGIYGYSLALDPVTPSIHWPQGLAQFGGL